MFYFKRTEFLAQDATRPILKVMRRPTDTRSSSPLLPFSDDTDAPDNRSPDGRLPTAFITYSHETNEHNERVLNLAKKLRADGVVAEIDSFQVSPPEGWPAWMRKQTEESDFVIVVCTETYARRFAGNETLPWCINTGKSLIPLTLRFLAQKRNLLIPLELSRVMHQGTSSPATSFAHRRREPT